MDIRKLQAAIGAEVDGQWGPMSRMMLLANFTNFQATAINEADIAAVADRLGCTPKQVRAVAKVESSGAGFDKEARPKILFERHLFHRLTGGRWSVAGFSSPVSGGYSEDSWAKLCDACGKDPDAAFSAVSWGKFQVLGMHWSKLGYASPYDLAHSTVAGELGHYELLARYVLAFRLTKEIRALSTNPADCEAFAAAYNGSGFRRFSYHTKLAEAMR